MTDYWRQFTGLKRLCWDCRTPIDVEDKASHVWFMETLFRRDKPKCETCHVIPTVTYPVAVCPPCAEHRTLRERPDQRD